MNSTSTSTADAVANNSIVLAVIVVGVVAVIIVASVIAVVINKNKKD